MLAALAGLAQAAGGQWRSGVLTLSDGTAIKGRIQFAGDSLILSDLADGHRYTINISEIRSLQAVIEEQSMEQKWLFRESGLDDKVYTGETFPVRHYVTHVTFHDGRVLSGHVVAKTVYVEADGQRQRFALLQKQEGKVGQKLEDLVYVRQIDFSEEGTGARGAIEGMLHLPEGERLMAVVAVNRDDLFSVEAQGDPASGRFRVGNCTEGTYDLVVVTDRSIYAFFSRERDEGAGRLDAPAVAQMQAWVDKLRDFFHSQRILYAAGNEKRAFALIWKERRGGTTLKEAALIHSYDVWAMQKPADEWQIDKRFFIFRAISSKADLQPLKVVISPSLGGHRITAPADRLELDLSLVHAPEQPVQKSAAQEQPDVQ